MRPSGLEGYHGSFERMATVPAEPFAEEEVAEGDGEGEEGGDSPDDLGETPAGGAHARSASADLMRAIGARALGKSSAGGAASTSVQRSADPRAHRAQARRREELLSPGDLPKRVPEGVSAADIRAALESIQHLEHSLEKVLGSARERLDSVSELERAVVKSEESRGQPVDLDPVGDCWEQPTAAINPADGANHSLPMKSCRSNAIQLGTMFRPPRGYEVLAREMLSPTAEMWSAFPYWKIAQLHSSHKHNWTFKEEDMLYAAVETELRQARMERLGRSGCAASASQNGTTCASYDFGDLELVDWNRVAEACASSSPTSRSAVDCKCRWQEIMDGKRATADKRGHFLKQEMSALRESVRKHGDRGRWKAVARDVCIANGGAITRTAAECVFAWKHRPENPVQDSYKHCSTFGGLHWQQAVGSYFTADGDGNHEEARTRESRRRKRTDSAARETGDLAGHGDVASEEYRGTIEGSHEERSRKQRRKASSLVADRGADFAEDHDEHFEDGREACGPASLRPKSEWTKAHVADERGDEYRENEVLWTKEDDDALREAVAHFGVDFAKVAKHSKLRDKFTREQCVFRWRNVLGQERTSGWSERLDEQLWNAVRRFERPDGTVPWARVAEQVDGKTDQLCRDRWVHALDPTLKKGRFSKEEDRNTVLGVKEWLAEHTPDEPWLQEHPPVRWSDVSARHVPERVGRQLKMRWRKLYEKNLLSTINDELENCSGKGDISTGAAGANDHEGEQKVGRDAAPAKRRTKDKGRIHWTETLIQQLKDAVAKHGLGQWKKVAQELGHGITANVAKSKYAYITRSKTQRERRSDPVVRDHVEASELDEEQGAVRARKAEPCALDHAPEHRRTRQRPEQQGRIPWY